MHDTFFARVSSILAVDGREEKVLGIGGLCSMLLQICSDYSSLPNVRDITIEEIRFFYNPLRASLIESQIEMKKLKRKGN